MISFKSEQTSMCQVLIEKHTNLCLCQVSSSLAKLPVSNLKCSKTKDSFSLIQIPLHSYGGCVCFALFYSTDIGQSLWSLSFLRGHGDTMTQCRLNQTKRHTRRDMRPVQLKNRNPCYPNSLRNCFLCIHFLHFSI